MTLLFVALALFSPAIVTGVALGLAEGSCGRIVLGTLTGALCGTILCGFLGWEFIPFSLQGGPHGGALGRHLGKTLIAVFAGAYSGTILGAWLSVVLVRRLHANSATTMHAEPPVQTSGKKQSHRTPPAGKG